MLVLSRKCGEKVLIGKGITVTVVAAEGNRVKLAFKAPAHVRIIRSELVAKLQATQADEALDPELATKPAWWESPVPGYRPGLPGGGS